MAERTMLVRAVRAGAGTDRLAALFAHAWPSWRGWYLRDGRAGRPALSVAMRALATYLPELEPVWERLVIDVAGGDELAACFLTQYDPPPLVLSCSLAVLPGDDPVLVRNYDYDPRLFDGVVLETAFGSRRVMGMSDQLWGLLDGLNDAGLAAAFAFGGRREVGPGFGIPLVLRYLLETCDSVPAAVDALRRVPVHLAYTVMLLDRSGDYATVFVGPGRPPVVTRHPVSTNHQETVHWPEHARRVRSVERSAALRAALRVAPHGPGADPAALLAALLAPPVRTSAYDAGFGTLYTASYHAAAGTATYHWPECSWRQSVDSFVEGERLVQLTP